MTGNDRCLTPFRRPTRPSRAAASGEFTPRRVGPIESVLTDEARAIVADWQSDGGYSRALVAAADPDLAGQ